MFEFGYSAADELTVMKANSALSEQMEKNITRRFEATQSVKPEEAFVLALQQQEIAKFR
jgi:hypothetical protein